MSGLLSSDPMHHGAFEAGTGSYTASQDKSKDGGGGRWYFSGKEIEENSPSRQDGIDLKETYLRKSYCTFLQDLGMRLKVPQVTLKAIQKALGYHWIIKAILLLSTKPFKRPREWL